jgi:hypothetical protein
MAQVPDEWDVQRLLLEILCIEICHNLQGLTGVQLK